MAEQYTREKITALFDELMRRASDNQTADMLAEIRELIEALTGERL